MRKLIKVSRIVPRCRPHNQKERRSARSQSSTYRSIAALSIPVPTQRGHHHQPKEQQSPFGDSGDGLGGWGWGSIQSGNLIARRHVNRGESPTHDNLSIRLDGDTVDISIKPTANIRAEGRVGSAIRIQSSNGVARRPVNRSEKPTHDGLSIRLDGDTVDSSIKPTANIRAKGRVGSAIRIQSSDPVAPRPVNRSEIPTYDGLSIRLDGDTEDSSIKPTANIRAEGRVGSAIRSKRL